MTQYFKYPRTFHVDWSPGLQSDDKKQDDYSVLVNCPTGIIASIKMDGENCLHPNTKILTKQYGEITISEICDKKLVCDVMSFNHDIGEQEFQHVNNFKISSETDEWFEIVLENNETVILTGEHRVFLPKYGCYRQVKDLTEEDEILYLH